MTTKMIARILILFSGLAMAGNAAPTDAGRPNILILYADDLGYGDPGCYNPDSKIPTPNLDRLAAEGMRFTDGHSSSGICTPSRYALLTGRYHWRDFHGIVNSFGKSVFKPERLTLPEMLQAEGYHTAVIGKWHLGWDWDAIKKPNAGTSNRPEDFDWSKPIPDGPLAHGFDYYFGDTVINFPPYGWIENDRLVKAPDTMMNTKKWKAIKEGNWECRGGPMCSDWDPYQNIPVTTQKGVDYIKQRAQTGKPFFLYFAFPSPHAPIIPNDEFDGKSGAGPYGDFVVETDAACGKLLKALEESGQAENTIVIMSADNGPEHYAYPRDQKFDHWSAEPLRGLKRDIYEGGHRVPYIIRWPGVAKPGSVSDALVSQIDLMATLAEILDVKLPDTNAAEDSFSFLAVLRGEREQVRDHLVHNTNPPSWALRDGDWTLVAWKNGYHNKGFEAWEAKRKYPADDSGPVELYHMASDLGQRSNVAGEHPERVAAMQMKLQQVRKEGHSAPRLAKQDAVAPYDGSWASLQKMPVPAWFDDGKIGIFIHWGPYSVIGHRKGGRGYAEHVPKIIYRDPQYYYPYLQQRWGAKPPEFGYKDIIPEFTAENWDPAEWARLFKEVGARYVVLTAEHHDGWANWESDLTPWNAVNKGPKRDLVGDLGKALRKEGLKYAPSYHRERHTGFFAKEQYVVHSEPIPDVAEEIRRVPEAAMLYGPQFSYNKAFVDDYVARWKEIQDKYHPDMLWMDDFPIYTRDGNQVRKGTAKPEIQYFDDQVRGMIADFMNHGAARGQAVYVNNKGGNRNWPDGVGCLEKDNLKLKVIGPKWQSCTTFGTSFGYLEGDQYKSIEGVIHEMIEVISRNGNFLINIGPKADGTIPAPQVERLRAMGDWLAVNGDAIYGSRYWKVSEQQNEHLAFTTNGKTLYAIKLAKPTAPFTIEGTAGWSDDKVRSVKLLGADAAIQWDMTPAGLHITPPADLGQSDYAWTFEVVTDKEQHTPNVLVADADAALKNTRKVDLEGRVEKASPRQHGIERP